MKSNARMRARLLTFILCWVWPVALWAQSFTLMSWNIQDLGRTKDASELAAMVEVMRDYDLVAIQEVVAKDPAGAQAVAKLADALNRTGSRWDYRVSLPTRSPSPQASERYALLWKTAKLSLLQSPYLDRELAEICVREPFIGQFRAKGNPHPFYVVNVHARRFNQQPEEEIRQFAHYPRRLGTDRIVILGDFNMDEHHEGWQGLYQQGFQAALHDTPTTLKRACNGKSEYVNYPIDNLYFQGQVFRQHRAGRVDLVGNCSRLAMVRKLSDHLPVFVELSLREE